MVAKDAKESEDNNYIKYVTICLLKHIKFNKYICKKKSLVGGLTFPSLQTSVIKIQTREWLEKTHKSVLSTNNSTPNKYLTNTVGEFNKRKKITGGVDVSSSTEVCN